MRSFRAALGDLQIFAQENTARILPSRISKFVRSRHSYNLASAQLPYVMLQMYLDFALQHTFQFLNPGICNAAPAVLKWLLPLTL